MELPGNVVLVTGGAGGLGEATVRAAIAAGASVVIADLNDEKGEKIAAELGTSARYVRTDVLDDDSVNRAIAVAGELGTFRFAVAAHGGSGVAQKVVQRDGSPADMESFRKTVDLYLNGTYNLLRLAAAAIAKTEPNEDGERGAVVTTASIAAFEGQMGTSAYSAAKGGVVGLTLVAARDLGAVGVRVVCVAPGTMRTPILESSVSDEALAKFSAAVPFPRRLGHPSEYGALVVHILTNPYLNGETIRLDGAQRFQAR